MRNLRIKPEDIGCFVRCYYKADYGCMDAVLVDLADDVAEVYFIGLRVKEIVETSDIIAVGPALTASVPRF